MRRRELITLLGGAAMWPVTAWGQQPAMPIVGAFGLGSMDTTLSNRAGFRNGLGESGYFEGRNLTIDDVWADDQYDRLSVIASTFVQRRVSVIFAAGSAIVARAALAQTKTIPVVFANGSDPVRIGLVASLNRPGGNATGISFLVAALMPKKLELLRELVPGAKTIATLANPSNPGTNAAIEDFQKAASTLNQSVIVLNASTDTEIDAAFSRMARDGVNALVVSVDSFISSRRAHIAALAIQHRIAVMYSNRNFTESGGLMSYGDNRPDSFRLAGQYVGRILKGEKPAELPVLQPTKFELVVNLRAAKAIGLTIPEAFLLRADEVIE